MGVWDWGYELSNLSIQKLKFREPPPRMTSHGGGGVRGERIHTVQPERDLVANWEVDLSEKLEEYLLKICSGEITGNEEDEQIPVNFAEGVWVLLQFQNFLVKFHIIRF